MATLARRRFALSARTPRELLIPLLAPLLFAMVVAPALADTFGTTGRRRRLHDLRRRGHHRPARAAEQPSSPASASSSTASAAASRDLLAAPISRPLIVAGNLVVAVALAGLQVAVLLGAAALRGAEYDLSATGVVWFAAATLAFAVAHVRRRRGARQPPAQPGGVHRRRCQRSPSSRSSSPGPSSRSAPCPPGSPSSASCCPSPTCSPSCATGSSAQRRRPPRHLGHEQRHRHGRRSASASSSCSPWRSPRPRSAPSSAPPSAEPRLATRPDHTAAHGDHCIRVSSARLRGRGAAWGCRV